MLTTELETRDIPAIYERFAREIGEKHWKHRVQALKQDIKGNPFLERLHLQENAIAYQLEQLRELHVRFGGAAVQAYNDHSHYSAASFAAQVLSVLDASSPALAERFRRRVHGALKNPADMRAMRLEMAAATHFLRAGRSVNWPEMNPAGGTVEVGTFDLLIEDLGPHGLELECKSVSEQKGRRITRRQAIEFYWQLRSRHWDRLKRLRTGIAAVVEVPRDLPTQHKDRQALADALAKCVLHCAAGRYEAPYATVRLSEFDPQRLSELKAGVGQERARQLMDEVSGTRNREVVAFGTPSGGALVVAIQSAEDDDLMDSVMATLRDSAARQFSGKRPAMFVVGLDGLDAGQMLGVARQDQDPGAVPTALRLHTSRFLEMTSRDFLVGVTFLSASSLRPAVHDVLDSGGMAYNFPKRESPFWSEAFSGLFGQEPAALDTALLR